MSCGGITSISIIQEFTSWCEWTPINLRTLTLIFLGGIFLMCHPRILKLPQILRVCIWYFLVFHFDGTWVDLISELHISLTIIKKKKKESRMKNGALFMITILKPLWHWPNYTLTQVWLPDIYPGQEWDTNLASVLFDYFLYHTNFLLLTFVFVQCPLKFHEQICLCK